MKWGEENLKRLKQYISEGKRHCEIAKLFNTTKKTINNKCFRIGLSVIYYKKSICVNCGNGFEHLISEERKFCGSSCSAIYTNSERKHSERTKQKISETLKLIAPPKKPKPSRFCKNCNVNVLGKGVTICDICKTQYYKYYRPLCEFDFNFEGYNGKFNLSLVETYGWYSPSNKGNNLEGVSRDHMYSVKEGFMNNVSPDIVKHPANCKLLKHSENSSKNSNSSITLEELMIRIKEW